MLIKLNPKMESYPFVKLENNGSVLQIFACRVCLATETKLFDLHKHKLVDVFGELTGTQVSRTDGLPQYICSICCTLLCKLSAFRTKCRKVHVLLQDVRVRQPLITTDYIRSIDRSNLKLKFATTNTLTLDLVPKFVEEFIISEQTESSTELNPLVKAEPLTPNPEVTTDSNDCHNDTRKDDTNYEFIAIDTKIKEEVIVIEDKTKKAKPKKVSQKSTVRRTVKREKKRKRPCNMKFLDDFDEFAETYNCKVVFLTKEQQLKEVEERKETESYKRSRFKCTICYKGFMNVSAHQNHMATHDKSSGDHVCEICHSRFNARKTLLNHHHRCHKFSFICNICNYVNKKSYTAKSHYKWHEGFKYECKECNKQYNTRSTYMNHNREYHHSVTCELCKETVNGSKGLEEHNQQRHPIEKFPCKTCFQKFDSQEALDTHLSADGLCNSDFSCVKCGENFASKPLLHDHREAAHNETLFRCDKCTSAFPTGRILAIHWQWRHSDTTYMCEICAKRYKCKQALKAHRETHSAADKLGSSDELNMDDSLQVHVNSRTGKRPVTCNKCDATFKSLSQKYKHNRVVHKKERRVKCHLCEKSYVGTYTLKMHIRKFHMKLPHLLDREKNSDKTNNKIDV